MSLSIVYDMRIQITSNKHQLVVSFTRRNVIYMHRNICRASRIELSVLRKLRLLPYATFSLTVHEQQGWEALQ